MGRKGNAALLFTAGVVVGTVATTAAAVTTGYIEVVTDLIDDARYYGRKLVRDAKERKPLHGSFDRLAQLVQPGKGRAVPQPLVTAQFAYDQDALRSSEQRSPSREEFLLIRMLASKGWPADKKHVQFATSPQNAPYVSLNTPVGRVVLVRTDPDVFQVLFYYNQTGSEWGGLALPNDLRRDNICYDEFAALVTSLKMSTDTHND